VTVVKPLAATELLSSWDQGHNTLLFVVATQLSACICNMRLSVVTRGGLTQEIMGGSTNL
jgi:hypothetical protein